MKKYKLGEIANIEISNIDKKTKEGEIPIRLCNFVDVYKEWAITKQHYPNLMLATCNQRQFEKFQLHKGQVAITKDSETRDDIGVATYIADDFQDVVLGYHCALITPDKSIVDGRYLNAFMHSSYIQRYFENNATGSGMRYSLSVDTINDIPILLPSLSDQHKIGKLLAALDQKIALNRKTNQTLENMAKQLYDYYFVQFCFPDDNGKPYKASGGKMVYNATLKREVPEGWEVKRIEDYMKIFTGKKDVSKAIPGKYKFFSCAPTPITSDEFIFDGDAVLVSGNGSYTGRVNCYKGKFDLYQRTYACVMNKESLEIPFFYYVLKYLFSPVFSGGKHGSSIPYIVLGDLADFAFPFDIKTVKNFNKIVSPIYYRVLSNEQNIEYLTALRDELLPLLMNGQVQCKIELETINNHE